MSLRSAQVVRFVHRQQSFIAVAVAIYVGLWAADRPAPIGSTLTYTLSLCNLIVLMQDHLAVLYRRKAPLTSWILYVLLLFVVGIVGVMFVNAILFPAQRLPQQTIWQFLASGWKFPFIATMIVGVVSQVYRQTRERLELKNRELQRTLQRKAVEHELRDLELQQAREIQQSLLPKEIPQVAGFEIDGVWEPARVVGGDYFDVIKLGDSTLGICIADVAGKGVSAALLMANVQAIVRAFATESVSPAALCSRVNSVLCSSVTTGKFVTLFYGILDATRATLVFTNGGHPPPIMLGSDGSVSRLDSGGAVVGVFPDWSYEDSCVQLSAGDRLLLFTDGITEAALPNGEEFGEERIIASAQAVAANSAADLKTRLLNDVKQFCAAQLSDDATLIVIAVEAATVEATQATGVSALSVAGFQESR